MRSALGLAISMVVAACASSGCAVPLQGPTLLGCEGSGLRGALTCPTEGGPSWREVSSPRFTVRTDMSSECARTVIVDLERSYEALRELAFPFDVLPAQRIHVLVFSREEDYRAIGPEQAAAAFRWGGGIAAEGPLAIASTQRWSETRSVLQHELTHYFVRLYYAQAPLWVNEGLASYYETLDVEEGYALLGRSGARRWLIRPPGSGGPQLPHVAELVSMSQHAFYVLDTPGADGDLTRGAHYAAAWGLVHYLRNGPEAHRARFDRYLELLASGAGAKAAWSRAFQGVSHDELDEGYRSAMIGARNLTVQRTTVLRTRYQHPPPPALRESSMTDAKVHLAWAGARVQSDAVRVQDTRNDVAEALRLAPDDPDGLLAQAELDVRAGRWDRAHELGERAVAARPDDVRLVYGLAEILWLGDVTRARGEPRWDRFEALVPRLVGPAATPSSLNLAAWAAAMQDQPDRGLDAAKRALRADPGCAACYDTFAALLYQKGQVDAAHEAQTLAVNVLPHGKSSRTIFARLRFYERAVASKRAASDPSAWKAPPLDLR